jgi:predicted phosphodiesterase
VRWGHTHLPLHRWVGALTVLNPSSVGLPRDSGGKATYAVYEQGKITLKQVAYDVEATIADLQRGPFERGGGRAARGLLRA